MAPQHFLANWSDLSGKIRKSDHNRAMSKKVPTQVLTLFFFFCSVLQICVFQDILKDQWSPALTIKTALLSLQALLCSPEPKDPQDAEVAKMYLNDRSNFDQTAKFWTETYAKETNQEEAIARVCDMGFDRKSAKRALEKHGWDESAAVNELLGGI